MREQFTETVTSLFEGDEKTVLLLGDIGVHGFAPLAEKYPKRVINMGICEQATIGVASGMAKEGLHPIFYTIAPFAVERCYEQIKVDIGYQKLPITIVSVGGSYDYGMLGCTHHCPADVALMKNIPGMLVFAPTNKEDVDTLLNWFHGAGACYMRLPAKESVNKSSMFNTSNERLILAYGDTIDNVMLAYGYMGINIIQYTIVANPHRFLHSTVKKIAIVEPWYEGTMQHDVQVTYPDAKVISIGVPHKFITGYGTKEQLDKECGLDVDSLNQKLTEFFNG